MTDDALLTGLIDGELDPAEAAALQLRLATEPQLAERLAQLKAAQPDFRAAFAALAESAPVERLRARLDPHLAPAAPWASRRQALVGGAAAALLALGVVLGRVSAPEKSEDWRETVSDYMNLYVDAAFPATPPDRLAQTLTALGQKIGRPLDPSILAIDGLTPQFAAALSYQGASLAEIGYQEGDFAIALCIIKNGEADAPPSATQSGRLTRVAWSSGGRGYMAIGAASPSRIEGFARAARSRLN